MGWGSFYVLDHILEIVLKQMVQVSLTRTKEHRSYNSSVF